MALKTPHLSSNFARAARPSSHSFSPSSSPPHQPKLPPRPDPQTRVAIATNPPPPQQVVRRKRSAASLLRCRDSLHGCTDGEAVPVQTPEDHQATELPVVTHPSVVFPGATLQLHAFEFRSRIMTHTLLQQGLSFGVICSANSGGMADVGCVVHVVECERLTDGRFFLTCVGTDRFRVVETVRTKPYVVARVQVLSDRDRDHSHHHVHGGSGLQRDLMQQVERHLGNVAALADKLGQKPPLPYRQGDRLHTAASLSFLVARLFVDDRREQQALLRMEAASRFRRRLRAAAHLLRCHFPTLLLVVVEHVGPPTPAVAGASESMRRSSPVAVAKKSREPKLMRLPGAKVLPMVRVND